MEPVAAPKTRILRTREEYEAWLKEPPEVVEQPRTEELRQEIGDASREERPDNPICAGLDIGQISDNSVLVVCEAMRVWRGRQRLVRHIDAFNDHRGFYHQSEDVYEKLWDVLYVVRRIVRFELGTSFADIAIRVADVLGHDDLFARPRRLLIDRTGIGLPVFGMIEHEMRNRPATNDVLLKPVVFTGTDNYEQYKTDPRMGVGYEVSRLGSLFESDLVELPDTELGHMLKDELLVHQRKRTQTGKATYGAESGKHDDMMTALALACADDPFADMVSYYPNIWEK